MGCREEEGKNAYQTTFMCSCALVGGGGGEVGEGGWRCWAEERGANALQRERRRRAYSYCSCPPVNKGLIGVHM